MKNSKYDWKRSEFYPKPNGLKVFGTFVCGGGSTMGYKLAGFEHFVDLCAEPELIDEIVF